MDDSLTRSRPKSPDEILRSLQAKARGVEQPDAPRAASVPVPPPDEPEAFDPDPEHYQAWRPGTQTVPSVRFILKDRSERGFAYAHLDSKHPGGCEFIPSAPGKGNLIRLRFAGAASATMVTLEGRNLRRGWAQLIAHQTPWVCEYPADIDTVGADEPIITAIGFAVEKD